jgi:hypothetical protein
LIDLIRPVFKYHRVLCMMLSYKGGKTASNTGGFR